MAASPVLIFHAFTNFDALATACAAGAMLAWARRRPVLAGALIGIGVALKLYPLLLFVPLLILGLRTGRLREVGKTALAAVATWLVVNLPIMVLFPRGWAEFFILNTRRGDDMDSLYNVVKSFTGWSGFDPAPRVLGAAVGAQRGVRQRCSCCVVVAIAYIGLTAQRRPRLAQLAFLVVAAFLLTNKVWSPQYSLWLVPLAALALPHRRILLAWMTIDALVWVPRMLFLYGEQNMGLPEQWFTTTVLLRDVAVMALCALVIRQIYRPELDLVREPGPGHASTIRRAAYSRTRPTIRGGGCRRACVGEPRAASACARSWLRGRVAERRHQRLHRGPGAVGRGARTSPTSSRR